MTTANTQWSTTEQAIARSAFDTAYHREIAAIMAEVKRQSEAATSPDALWTLNDFLSARRHYLDGKYEFSEEILVFLFAQLVKEGLLDLAELQGLSADKLSKIRLLTMV